MVTVKKILKAIANPCLGLHRDPSGYFYFVYDGERYETEAVMVTRLNHMSLEIWIKTGRDFVANNRSKHNDI